jgi:hypothetical protein
MLEDEDLAVLACGAVGEDRGEIERCLGLTWLLLLALLCDPLSKLLLLCVEGFHALGSDVC